jgi:hypothetical protein
MIGHHREIVDHVTISNIYTMEMLSSSSPCKVFYDKVQRIYAYRIGSDVNHS